MSASECAGPRRADGHGDAGIRFPRTTKLVECSAASYLSGRADVVLRFARNAWGAREVESRIPPRKEARERTSPRLPAEIGLRFDHGVVLLLDVDLGGRRLATKTWAAGPRKKLQWTTLKSPARTHSHSKKSRFGRATLTFRCRSRTCSFPFRGSRPRNKSPGKLWNTFASKEGGARRRDPADANESWKSWVKQSCIQSFKTR